MPLINTLLTWYLKKRIPDIEHFISKPAEVQHTLLFSLIEQARHTEWGKKYHFHEIKTLNQFKERVPVGNYESHKPFIERMMRGEQNVLWPTEVK